MITQNEKAAIKAFIDAMPVEPVVVVPPVVTPPPTSTWTRLAPNMLDIDLINQDSLLKSHWLDGNKGFDGLGGALHYGDLAGQVDSWQPFMIPGKLSNPSIAPIWGTEANGLHYLEHGTDGTKEPAGSGDGSGACVTCRVINWQFSRFAVPELYSRFMVYVSSVTLANQAELGIKLSGMGGTLVNGGSFAEIFELGKQTATGWPLVAYRYDGEGDQGVTPFPNFELKPDRWYTLEEHVKVSTGNTVVKDAQGRLVATSNPDGVIEFKVDGNIVFSRKDVKMGASAITGWAAQIYHGGVRKPRGPMKFRTARIALSTNGWIGPAPEVAA